MYESENRFAVPPPDFPVGLGFIIFIIICLALVSDG